MKNLANETESVALVAVNPVQEKALDHDIRRTLADIDVTSMPRSVDGVLQETRNIARRNFNKQNIEATVTTAKESTANLYYGNTTPEILTDIGVELAKKPYLIFPLALAGALTGAIGVLAGIISAVPMALLGVAVNPFTFMVGGAIAAPIALLGFDKTIDRVGGFKRNRAYKKLDKIADALPESDLKTAIREFRLTSEANAHFLRASYIIKQYGYTKKRQINKAFNEIAKGADILGLSEIEKAKLHRKLLDQDFPGAKYFKNDIEKRAARVMRAFRNADETLFNQLERPQVKAIEHKPEMPAEELLGTRKQKMPELK